jgi:YHS domain-containing protein
VIRLILLAVLILLLARAFWRLVDGILESAGGMPRGQMRGGGPAVKLVRDPVCGTFVAPGKALSSTAGGAIHYFCSEQCRSKFRSAS